ncbi:MAG: nitroreductase [Patescibacteria group bacterium]
MNTIIKKILEIAVQAPSGENAQPWKFSITNNQIYVFNIPERDQSLYNFQQRASFVAHGTLIENISIAASYLGYQIQIRLFPEIRDTNLVAVISLIKSQGEDPLFPYIPTRSTNRKPYKTQPLTHDQKNEILKTADELGKGKIMLTEDRKKIVALAHVGSMNERVVFENPYLHAFLFTHINWTEQEEKVKRLGFYIKTLELPFLAQIGFRLFRYWSLVSILNHLGLSKAIWKQNAKVYSSCAAIGVIVTPQNTPEDFVYAGRIMQRSWLKATKMGLSIQPMTGVLFFMQRISEGKTQEFSSEQIQLIRNSYNTIKEAFGITNGTIAMMFRIGYSDKPTAHSLKLSPIIIETD